MPSGSADSFFVYILRCSDGSLYVGHSANLNERVEAHNDGRAAMWTGARRPVELVYSEPAGSEREAVSRERQIKGWTRAKKLALIRGDLQQLKSLAKRRLP